MGHATVRNDIDLQAGQAFERFDAQVPLAPKRRGAIGESGLNPCPRDELGDRMRRNSGAHDHGIVSVAEHRNRSEGSNRVEAHICRHELIGDQVVRRRHGERVAVWSSASDTACRCSRRPRPYSQSQILGSAAPEVWQPSAVPRCRWLHLPGMAPRSGQGEWANRAVPLRRRRAPPSSIWWQLRERHRAPTRGARSAAWAHSHSGHADPCRTREIRFTVCSRGLLIERCEIVRRRNVSAPLMSGVHANA